jgi:hypothetical protein
VGDISEEVTRSVDSAMAKGGRAAGWTVKTAAFMEAESKPGSTRWFTPGEIRDLLESQYEASVSDAAVQKILEDAVRTNCLGCAGGRYRTL